jgi:tRNA pseudouridine38-40 synthase
MSRNIRLTVEYDGTGFFGWQTQNTDNIVIPAKAGLKHVRTVQEEIEKAADKLFGKKIRLIGSGRTDSGVHAEAQIANFKVKSTLPLSNIQKGLNRYLPDDVAIISAEDADPDFHARFDAREKLYRYTILNRKTRSPLLKRYAALVCYDLNIDAMKEAAAHLIGRHDFKSFQAADKKERSSVRTIKKLDVIDKFPVIEIYVQADGFLYNMVRNIAGTLIDAGRGKIPPGEVKNILSKKHRPAAGQTAAAKGLCLIRVYY